MQDDDATLGEVADLIERFSENEDYFDTATNTETEYVSRFYSETDDAKLLMMPVRELESRLANLPKDALGVMWCGRVEDEETKYILK